ncbi:hypothetical protein K474DRAFT_1671769 [Panus rudis PR-1116 ss-1]|nr:hypothetical protein K474DRAFT_1671769 [Panus rudis PR-1116 ss-1]
MFGTFLTVPVALRARVCGFHLESLSAVGMDLSRSGSLELLARWAARVAIRSQNTSYWCAHWPPVRATPDIQWLIDHSDPLGYNPASVAQTTDKDEGQEDQWVIAAKDWPFFAKLTLSHPWYHLRTAGARRRRAIGRSRTHSHDKSRMGVCGVFDRCSERITAAPSPSQNAVTINPVWGVGAALGLSVLRMARRSLRPSLPRDESRIPRGCWLNTGLVAGSCSKMHWTPRLWRDGHV